MRIKIMVLLTCVFSVSLLGQSKLNNVDVKVYYSPLVYSKFDSKVFYDNIFGLNPNYKISKMWDIGIYGGFSRIEVLIRSQIQPHTDEYYSSVVYVGKRTVALFGVNANFHLLPLFTDAENLRYDVYATGKIGGFYVNATNTTFYKHGFTPEYSMGVGLSIRLWKHFGVFTEYDYGKFISYNIYHRWRFGAQLFF